MYTYTKQEDGSIKKEGLTKTFTIPELQKHYDDINKAIRECEDNIKLKELIMGNVMEHNEFISDLSLEKRSAVYVWNQNHMEKGEFATKLEEIQKIKDELLEEIKDIEKQLKEKIELKELEPVEPPKEDKK